MVSLNFDIVLTVALIFIRVSALIFTLPLFGDSPVPPRVRIFLALAIAIMLYQTNSVAPNLTGDKLALPSLIELILMIVKEVLVGILFGFVARLTFAGINAAASLVGFQMGFGTANLLTTDWDHSDSAFAEMHRIIIFLIFISLNLHFLFISGIAETFKILPIGGGNFGENIPYFLLTLSSELFVIAMKLSAPVLIALLFTNAAMGLMGRSVPQINIFILSFPVSFFLGLFVYIATLPFLPEWCFSQFDHMRENLSAAMQMLN